MNPILSRLLPPVRLAALLLALACAGMVLMGQAGRWSRVLDVPNNLEPVWLTGGLVAALAWLLAGRKGWLTPGIAGAAVLVATVQMAPELLARRDRGPAPPGVQTIRIVQFNVFAGNKQPEATARWILAQDADIVVIEEGFGDAEPILGALKARYPYLTTCSRHAPCSTNIFSRRAPIAEGGLLEPGQRARVAAAWAVYPDPAGPIPVVGMHLTWPYPPGWQQFQSCWIGDLVDRMPKPRLIIAGDFNLTPWSFDLRRKDRRFGIERRTRALATFPHGAFNPFPVWTPVPVMPIDHVYAGEGWQTVSVERGPKTASDHYPVIATLAARPGVTGPWVIRPSMATCN